MEMSPENLTAIAAIATVAIVVLAILFKTTKVAALLLWFVKLPFRLVWWFITFPFRRGKFHGGMGRDSTGWKGDIGPT